MITKVKTLILIVVLYCISNTLVSQCLIKEAQELKDYKRTKQEIEDGMTKFVESKWHKSSSNFEFQIFLYYQKLENINYDLGINKGTITFSISNIGNVLNGVVFYSDGSFDNIVPFSVEWKKEDFTYPTKFSFILKGGVFSTEDKITETSITNVPRSQTWLKNSIDLSKLPTKIVLLTDKGSKEYVITTSDYLNMQCILNRYTTPHQEDIH